MSSRRSTRVVSAASAARRSVSRLTAPQASPVAAHSRSAMATVAMAPRTEAPLRKRGCSRVARVRRTAVLTSAASSQPVSATTMSALLVGRLIQQRQVLEAVAQRLGEVAGGDVLHRVLRGHDLEALGGAHLADVRHLQEALVERRQQHVLHGLGHAVELVDEQHPAAAHGLDQRARRRTTPRGSPA